jgi:hypothetical protein
MSNHIPTPTLVLEDPFIIFGYHPIYDLSPTYILQLKMFTSKCTKVHFSILTNVLKHETTDHFSPHDVITLKEYVKSKDFEVVS